MYHGWNMRCLFADRQGYLAMVRSWDCRWSVSASFRCHGEDDAYLLVSKLTSLLFQSSIWRFFRSIRCKTTSRFFEVAMLINFLSWIFTQERSLRGLHGLSTNNNKSPVLSRDVPFPTQIIQFPFIGRSFQFNWKKMPKNRRHYRNVKRALKDVFFFPTRYQIRLKVLYE